MWLFRRYANCLILWTFYFKKFWRKKNFFLNDFEILQLKFFVIDFLKKSFFVLLWKICTFKNVFEGFEENQTKPSEILSFKKILAII